MNEQKKPSRRPSTPPQNRTKTFRLGIVAGRFQPLHKGHLDVIDAALRVCERVGVMIGSSQESMTANNPLSYDERVALLRQVYEDRILICLLPDIGVGNTRLWGSYLLKTAELSFGALPEVIVSGEEDRRQSWFDKNSPVLELNVKKSTDISASEIRSLIASGRASDAAFFLPDALLPCLGYLTNRIIECGANTDTESL